jgi:phage baseplate assembly protein W
MRVLADPLRIAGDAFATVEQWTPAEARQVGVIIVSTFLRERPLAPDFGIFDPVAVGTSEAEVRGAIELSEPDLQVDEVTITRTGDRQAISVSVQWIDLEAESGV